jgi:hypothetical protein
MVAAAHGVLRWLGGARRAWPTGAERWIAQHAERPASRDQTKKVHRMPCSVGNGWTNFFGPRGRTDRVLFPTSQRNRPVRVLVGFQDAAREAEVDPCGYLAEAQVGVTSTGVPCLFGQRIQLPASAPPSALAATADKLHCPPTRVAAVGVRPVQDGSGCRGRRPAQPSRAATPSRRGSDASGQRPRDPSVAGVSRALRVAG